MGRPKGYDREEAIRKAMALFWKQGFEGTSTQQLVDHLGINRNSMYSEFGSKKDFYNTVLEYYEQTEYAPHMESLEDERAGREEIIALFEHYSALARRRPAATGCLLCNNSIELAPHDKESRVFSTKFVDRTSGAFRNAIENAGSDALAVPDIEKLAAYLTSAYLGILVLLRLKASPDFIQSVAEAATEHLDLALT